ncbi:MAG TPA: UDP-N-acetylmuramoyl-tripeptide--D-alanyl-D-alanine ligase, partial [Clostridiales bacterium]|nr:UDP-N-acetylmuramoyl-tripeptide--D-alanyl-D-alanine ligase [Clostridiales bacterium]
SSKDIIAGIFSVKYKTQKTMGNYNNELGVPLTILSLDEDCKVAIVEMGLEKKGDLLFLKDMVKPNIGILTNVGTAHLENFNCVEEIANAKLEIVDCIEDNGLFIYNGDDELIKDEIKKISINNTLTIKRFGQNEDNDLYYSIIDQDENGITFETYGEVKDSFGMNMLGKHQALNALAAILAAKRFDLTNTDIKNGLSKIEKTGLRNEIVKIKNCTILNDSYKSNPQSTLVALDTFEGLSSPKKIVVLGDMLGLGKNEAKLHYEIGTKLSNYKVDELVTYGQLAKNIAEGASNVIQNIKMFDDKELMTEYLSKYLDEECTILIKASRSLALDEVVDKLRLK